jgi:hypothetical protein
MDLRASGWKTTKPCSSASLSAASVGAQERLDRSALGYPGDVSNDASPDWVRQGLRQFFDEVRLFARTAFEFTLHPPRFAREWAAGHRRALNPLGFLATAFGVIAPFEAIVSHLLHQDERSEPLVRAALAATLPFGYYLLVGSAQHAVLRMFGSRRPLRDSWAMALYAGGGPASAARLVIGAGSVLLCSRSGHPVVPGIHDASAWLLMVGATVSFSLFFYTLSAALAGVHFQYGIRWWHILVANLVAIVASGLLFGLLAPPGRYGLHLVIDVGRHAHRWRFGISD